MTDYNQAIVDLKAHLDSVGIPYLDMGIATEKIIVRVKFQEYADNLPTEINGIPIVSSVVGRGATEYPYGW